MTIPLEMRGNINAHTLPDEVCIDHSTCSEDAIRHPIDILDRPELPLRMISKQADQEVMQTRHTPLVANFHDVFGLIRWWYAGREGTTTKPNSVHVRARFCQVCKFANLPSLVLRLGAISRASIMAY